MRGVRQGRARGGRGRGAAGRGEARGRGGRCSPTCPTASAAPSRPSPPPAGCTRPVSSTPPVGCSACARTSAATTRWTRSSAGPSARAGCRSPARSSRQRPALVRARPEGRGRRLPDRRGCRRTVEPCDRARGRSRHHDLRLRARRTAERLHRDVARPRLTGVLLVAGASTRFGSPKALARLGEETLAERAWRVLGEACDERLAVGKQEDGLELPFELLDDGSDIAPPSPGSSPASEPRRPSSRWCCRSTCRS